jgi:DNA-binding XRE family transcriptional regulator
MQKNPLILIRGEKNLTVSDLAILADVSNITIQRIESGNSKTVPNAVLGAIKAMGYDGEKFESDYATWRSQKIKQLQEQVNK